MFGNIAPAAAVVAERDAEALADDTDTAAAPAAEAVVVYQVRRTDKRRGSLAVSADTAQLIH